jgi:hypothetical protein
MTRYVCILWLIWAKFDTAGEAQMNSISAVYHRYFVCLLAFIVIHICVIKFAFASELRDYDSEIRQLERSLTEHEQRMKAQERLLGDYQAALDRQRTELDALRRHLDEQTRQNADAPAQPPGSRYVVQPVSMPGDRGAAGLARPNGTAVTPGASPVAAQTQGQAQTQAQTRPQPGTGSAPVEQDKPRERPDIPLIVEKGGVLLRQGQIVVEPALDFSLVETNRVEVAGFTVLPAILVGNFTISQVERETLTAALTGRVGVTDRLELEARVPYVRRDDTETRRPIGTGAAADETVKLDGDGLGDVEFAAHYQINDGSRGWPFFVGNLRAKSDTGTSPFDVDTDSSGNPTELPTGTGFWSVQPSITAIMPTDPAVIFANLNYTWNIARDIDGFGDIDPGDTFGGSLGIGFALNEKLSISMAYDHVYVLKTTHNDVDTNSAFHIGRMLFGGSYRFSDRAAVNLNFAVGVTEQAPDIQTELRVPITFQPFR